MKNKRLLQSGLYPELLGVLFTRRLQWQNKEMLTYQRDRTAPQNYNYTHFCCPTMKAEMSSQTQQEQEPSARLDTTLIINTVSVWTTFTSPDSVIFKLTGLLFVTVIHVIYLYIYGPTNRQADTKIHQKWMGINGYYAKSDQNDLKQAWDIATTHFLLQPALRNTSEKMPLPPQCGL